MTKYKTIYITRDSLKGSDKGTCPKCGKGMDYEDLGDYDCPKWCWICPTCDFSVRDY